MNSSRREAGAARPRSGIALESFSLPDRSPKSRRDAESASGGITTESTGLFEVCWPGLRPVRPLRFRRRIPGGPPQAGRQPANDQ